MKEKLKREMIKDLAYYFDTDEHEPITAEKIEFWCDLAMYDLLERINLYIYLEKGIDNVIRDKFRYDWKRQLDKECPLIKTAEDNLLKSIDVLGGRPKCEDAQNVEKKL